MAASPNSSGIRIQEGQTAGGYVAQPMPPDLFVIVRPPPSKQTHPLNLQIQLINPTVRSNTYNSGSSRTSGEFSRSSTSTTPMDSPSSLGAASFDAVAGASVGGTGLRRTTSSSSSRSGRSIISVGSGISTGTGGRRVEPLYNLEFHALLPTVVTDAGTDQKVAKFLKRGVDILGLAILDPTDLATPPASPAHSPASPALSPAVSPSNSPQIDSSSSFLNRFKRMSFKPQSFSPPSKPSTTLSPSASIGDSLTPHGAHVLPLIRTVSNTEGSRSPARPNAERGYAFSVRKFTRRDLEGSKEGEEAAQQLRFEWRRAAKRPRRQAARDGAAEPRPSMDRRGSASSIGDKSEARLRGPSPGAPRRQRTLAGEDLTEDPNNLCAPSRRRKSISGGGASNGGSRPNSTHSHSDVEQGPAQTEVEDDGAESDPEDSERPWTCYLVHSPSGFGLASPTNTRRTLLGTLVPAAHHPRVVATLSVPCNLAPVALGTPQAGGTWGARQGLSVEEIKDCLSVSCLWVVVREGLGGLSGAKAGLGASQLKPKMLKEGWKLGR